MDLNNFSPRENFLFLLSGYAFSQAIFLANEFRLADLLGDEKKSITQLSSEADVNESILSRLMQVLASVNIFEETNEGYYQNNESSQFLRSNHADSLNALVTHFSQDYIQSPIRHLSHTLKTGEPAFVKAFNSSIIDYFSSNSNASRLFNDAMAQVSSENMKSIIDAYQFKNGQTIVDLGGGYGGLLAGIIASIKVKKAICLDLPHVIQNVPKEWQSMPNFTFESGSFYDELPEGDIFILKHIIHGLSDDKCQKLLKNCAKYMKKTNKLLIIDAVPDKQKKYNYAFALDMNMMAVLEGAKERTEEELNQLLQPAGFKINAIYDSGKTDKIIEVIKK